MRVSLTADPVEECCLRRKSCARWGCGHPRSIWCRVRPAAERRSIWRRLPMRWRRSSRRWRTLCLPRNIRRSRWRLWAARSTDRERPEKRTSALPEAMDRVCCSRTERSSDPRCRRISSRRGTSFDATKENFCAMKQLIADALSWEELGEIHKTEYQFELGKGVLHKEAGRLTLPIRCNFVMPFADCEKVKAVILQARHAQGGRAGFFVPRFCDARRTLPDSMSRIWFGFSTVRIWRSPRPSSKTASWSETDAFTVRFSVKSRQSS